MDKYKNFVRIEEIKTLIRQGKNEEALELCEGMEPKKIKDNWDCMVLAEVYLFSQIERNSLWGFFF